MKITYFSIFFFDLLFFERWMLAEEQESVIPILKWMEILNILFDIDRKEETACCSSFLTVRLFVVLSGSVLLLASCWIVIEWAVGGLSKWLILGLKEVTSSVSVNKKIADRFVCRIRFRRDCYSVKIPSYLWTIEQVEAQHSSSFSPHAHSWAMTMTCHQAFTRTINLQQLLLVKVRSCSTLSMWHLTYISHMSFFLPSFILCLGSSA